MLHITFCTRWSCFPGESLGSHFSCKERLNLCVHIDQRGDDTEAWADEPWLLQKQGSWVFSVRFSLATDLTAFLLLKLHHTGTASVSPICSSRMNSYDLCTAWSQSMDFAVVGSAPSVNVIHLLYEWTLKTLMDLHLPCFPGLGVPVCFPDCSLVDMQERRSLAHTQTAQ